MDSDSGRRRRVMDSDTNTVLELRMKKASFLKNVSEVLSELFTTAEFKFFRTGLELRATGTSDFPFVVLQLLSKGFDPDICDDDLSVLLNRLNLADMDELSVRLNLADMTKAFSFADNDDIVTIKYENGRKIITISLDSPEGAVMSRPVAVGGDDRGVRRSRSSPGHFFPRKTTAI